MNKAQKRAWLVFGISGLTLLISGAVLLYARANGIIFIDFERVLRMRMFSALLMFPLILIIFIEHRYHKRDFDERDKVIYRKSAYPCYVSGFVFMLAAGLFLTLSVKPFEATAHIHIWMCFTFVLYLAIIVSFLVSSIAVLIQYGREKQEVRNE